MKGVSQKLIRDGPYVRNIERQLFDGFIKKYHGQSISASRIREMRSIFGRTTLPENYKDVFSDKLARFNASKDLQEAAEETFWEQMDPGETKMWLQNKTDQSIPTRLADDREDVEANSKVAEWLAEKRKMHDVIHELSESAAKRPKFTNVSEVEHREKFGLVATGERQSSSEQSEIPLKPWMRVRVLSVNSFHPCLFNPANKPRYCHCPRGSSACVRKPARCV